MGKNPNESPIDYCLASIEKGPSNHDVVMVGRNDTENIDGRVWGCACARVCACIRPCIRVCAEVPNRKRHKAVDLPP